MENYIDDKRIHEGHRQRMRHKLFAHGQRIFDTYELLEMLLYHVIPYKDTNPIAKRLLCAFGSLDGVLSAARESLLEVSGVGERTADFLCSVGQLSHVIGAELLPEVKSEFSSYDKAGEFLVRHFSTVSGPEVVAMLLDNNMRLLEIKTICNLDYESAGVRPKLFIDAAVSAGAAAVITAHNHPAGMTFVSHGDRITNYAVSDALEIAGVVHAEHFVICGESYTGISLGKSSNHLLRRTMPRLSLGGDRDPIPENEVTGQIPPPDAAYSTVYFDYFTKLFAFVEGDNAPQTVHRMLGKFLTIENAFSTSTTELSCLLSERAAFFVKLLAYVTSRRVTDRITFGKVYSQSEILEYLKALFVGESVEKIYILSFDRKSRLAGCDLIGEGTVSSSEVVPRKAIEIAIQRSSSSVALAHNHPLGSPDPSKEDLVFTGRFAGMLQNCEITLSAHYVVAGQTCINIEINN